MVLAMTDGEGKPYCIPLNGVRAGEKIYFHCAKAGEKVDCLRTHPQVCLTAVGHQRVIPVSYTHLLKRGVAHGGAVRRIHGPDVDGDQEGAESHHGQKEAQLVAAERLVYLAAEQQEVEGKVDVYKRQSPPWASLPTR